CGAAPITILLTQELRVDGWDGPDVVLDGGGLVTLDGQNATRILGVHSSYERVKPVVTVQRIRLIRGLQGGAGEIDNGGGAIFRVGGELRVIDVEIADSHCP